MAVTLRVSGVLGLLLPGLLVAGCSAPVTRLHDGDIPNAQVAILVAAGASHPQIKETLAAVPIVVNGTQCASVSQLASGVRNACTGPMLLRAGPLEMSGRIETRRVMAGDLYKWREGSYETRDDLAGGHLYIFEVVPQGKDVAVVVRKVCRSGDLARLASRMKEVWPALQARVAGNHQAAVPVFECESLFTQG